MVNCLDKNYLSENHKELYDNVYNKIMSCYDDKEIAEKLAVLYSSGECYEKNKIDLGLRKNEPGSLKLSMEYKLNCEPKVKERKKSIFQKLYSASSSRSTSPSNSRPSSPTMFYSKKSKKRISKKLSKKRISKKLLKKRISKKRI